MSSVVTGVTPIHQRIAKALGVRANQAEAAVQMLDEGATVPFIARYRKERTNGLDDAQLRALEEQLHYLRDLDERRETILTSIREQEKLNPQLEQQIWEAETKTRLEDLYLPYKPKRRTRGQIAREAGLEPLARRLWKDPMADPETKALKYVDPEKGVPDVKAALEGARFILMERFSEEADLLTRLRDYVWNRGFLTSRVVKDKEEEGAKYRDYFNHSEALMRIPSHRVLAILRGCREEFLRVDVVPDRNTLQGEEGIGYCEETIAKWFRIKNLDRPADAWLMKTVEMAWKTKIHASIKLEMISKVREIAEAEAIKVFARNLNDLLMAAPAGQRTTMGLDPGLRTGTKVAIVDGTGKLVAHETIYPHAPHNRWEESLDKLEELALLHKVSLIAIGNGTASRETDRLATALLEHSTKIKAEKVLVSEAGASVYSASELATLEFPDLDVSIRGAVSIARRLQDPLAELVKIDPKAIGVGQYQHDVNQAKLARSLDAVVEDCVNAVGVDVNTASVTLLSRISGLSNTLAKNVVAYRDEHGRFRNRQQLMNVARMGPKSFEQAAGFLRIMDGDNPLDASSVHPEAYELAEIIARSNKMKISQLIGNSSFLKNLNPKLYTNDHFGVPTVRDILNELEKPGRDPRPEFKTAHFRDDVENINDLKVGMTLEGIISNVTRFGAFVDIGVHQDGLVHISQIADRFIKDPADAVKAGQVVTVKVLEVDARRKRISLTMRMK